MLTQNILTADEMRAAEAATIRAGTPGYELMERAGAALVDALSERPETALVLAGPGNNGGDGYVIARLLEEKGVRVRLHGLAPDALPPDAAKAAAAFRQAGGAILPWQSPPEPADLLVDALFGTGLSRDCDTLLAPFLRHGCKKVVAVDLPSGIETDTGRQLGQHVIAADLTVTFHAPKPAHLFGAGPDACGHVTVTDIGIAEDGAGIALIHRPLASLDKRQGHKFTHGHALLLSGAWNRGGAIRLAAQAALRVGAGLVTIAADAAAAHVHAARLDAVMVAPDDGLLRDPRVTATGLGPALGLDAAAEARLQRALASGKPLILDADALTLLARSRAKLPTDCILTPHQGEFARLCPDLAAQMADANPIALVQTAARRLGVALLLKGASTIIAGPDGRVAVHAALYERAAPWLATAGAGDVLTGLITGLRARGVPAFEAAATGAFLHVEAARRFGPGLIAEDLPDMLPAVLEKWTGQVPR